MISLIVIKYLFYLYIIIFIGTVLFDTKKSVNYYFLTIVGILLFIIYEIYTYISGSGFSILGALGLLLNLGFIYAGFDTYVSGDDKNDKDEKETGAFLMIIFGSLFIYLLW